MTIERKPLDIGQKVWIGVGILAVILATVLFYTETVNAGGIYAAYILAAFLVTYSIFNQYTHPLWIKILMSVLISIPAGFFLALALALPYALMHMS
ncbi:MAG: hypothetical protein ABIA93_01440 [Candidatus Woesearchaeota archaeon]